MRLIVDAPALSTGASSRSRSARRALEVYGDVAAISDWVGPRPGANNVKLRTAGTPSACRTALRLALAATGSMGGALRGADVSAHAATAISAASEMDRMACLLPPGAGVTRFKADNGFRGDLRRIAATLNNR